MRWLIAEQSAYATTIAIAGGILRSLKTTKIGSKGLRSLVIQLKERPLERIASQIKLQPATEQIGNLPWQRGEPIAVELQRPEAGELGDLGGQRGEPLPSSISRPSPVSWPISVGSAVSRLGPNIRSRRSPRRPAAGAGGQSPQRLPSADPGRQLPPAGHGHQHTTEAARRRLFRQAFPVRGGCAGGALAAKTAPASG